MSSPYFRSSPSSLSPPLQSLPQITSEIETCIKCPLSCFRSKIGKTVPGQGNPRARLLIVGEGPGYEEQKTGLAFVGPAGQLLTKMIAAIGMTRDEVFISNIVHCRPPGNRPPTQDEMAKCVPYLHQQIVNIKPEVILALGKTAAVGLGVLASTDALKTVRGKWNAFSLPGSEEYLNVMVSYHPAYLLRNPEEKTTAWLDFQLVRDKLALFEKK